MLTLFRNQSDQATKVQEPQPVEFINAIAAACSSHQGFPIDDGYRYLVRFFGSALLDRTETLQPGFPYRILDPIPQPQANSLTLAELCDIRGRELIAEAQSKDCEINVLWSGGIDSTTALTALLKAASEYQEYERIHVFYSRSSVNEYPRFFKQRIQPKLRHRRIRDVSQALNSETLIVTGEHGDQVFGSVLAGDYIRPARWYRREDKRLFVPWQSVLLPILEERLKDLDDVSAATKAYEFLLPQLQQSPIELHSLFDVLWWINFSMKWQLVTLRLATHKRKHYAAIRQALRHFFRTDAFQNWSLTHHEDKIGTDWPSYKMLLKRYIHAHHPDENYLNNKLKEPSLSRISYYPKDRIYDREYGVILSYERGVGDSCADSDGE